MRSVWKPLAVRVSKAILLFPNTAFLDEVHLSNEVSLEVVRVLNLKMMPLLSQKTR